jgi:hypothetical protein
MNNHEPPKRLVFVVIAATEKRAQLVLLKKRATNISMITHSTIKYIN